MSAEIIRVQKVAKHKVYTTEILGPIWSDINLILCFAVHFHNLSKFLAKYKNSLYNLQVLLLPNTQAWTLHSTYFYKNMEIFKKEIQTVIMNRLLQYKFEKFLN